MMRPEEIKIGDKVYADIWTPNDPTCGGEVEVSEIQANGIKDTNNHFYHFEEIEPLAKALLTPPRAKYPN